MWCARRCTFHSRNWGFWRVWAAMGGSASERFTPDAGTWYSGQEMTWPHRRSLFLESPGVGRGSLGGSSGGCGAFVGAHFARGTGGFGVWVSGSAISRVNRFSPDHGANPWCRRSMDRGGDQPQTPGADNQVPGAGTKAAGAGGNQTQATPHTTGVGDRWCAGVECAAGCPSSGRPRRGAIRPP